MKLAAGSRIYFMGIAGTGMASVAGLCKEAGYAVMGSDTNAYPPMSTMLAELGVPVFTPYAASNLEQARPDLVVVGNSLSRGNVELEHAPALGLPLTSFAALMGEAFLKERLAIVVSGTHGKTTTTAILAHLLASLGEDPSFLVGGVPLNFPRSYRLGASPLFVIEGDEYDTAYFDKESKFLHYHPDMVIFNNLEYDHVDIFPDLAAIEAMFSKLLAKVSQPEQIIANCDDPGVAKLLKQLDLSSKVTTVATRGLTESADFVVTRHGFDAQSGLWRGSLRTSRWGELDLATSLAGAHNFANIAQVIACLNKLADANKLRGGWGAKDLAAALLNFGGVKKRLDHLGRAEGIDIFEDFAHHPTAVHEVLASFRLSHPGRRVIVAFEPRNATSRRNIFTQRYIDALKKADCVLMGACAADARIPAGERMSTADLVQGIGKHALAFASNEELLAWAHKHLLAEDAIIFMSSGSFSGVPAQLLTNLREDSLRG